MTNIGPQFRRITDLESAAYASQLGRQFPGEPCAQLTFFQASYFDSSRLSHPVRRLDKTMREIDSNNFRRPAGKFKGGPPDGATQIQRPFHDTDGRKKFAHTSDRIKERLPWTKQVGQLILGCSVMKQKILIY